MSEIVTLLLAQWGIPGAIVAAASWWAVDNARKLEALHKEHAAKLEALANAHAAKLEELAKSNATERAALLSKLEAEHAARLTDAQANTRAMLELVEEIHRTVDQLSDLAERLSQRPRSPTND